MPWTAKQKSTAMIACKHAGISDEQRKLLLRQLDNALFDRDGKPTGEPSSTSARLNNGDFEWFMSQVESFAGGQISGNSAGYWQAKAEDETQRLRHLVRRIVNTLELEGQLQKDGVGLAGWIRQRIAGGRTDKLDDLTGGELHALVNSLRAHARRHGVQLQDEPRNSRPRKRVGLAIAQ